MRLACCLVLVLGGLQLASALRVGAWNIQRFGPTKASNPTVMGYISTIVQRYDIIVIEELQDTRPGRPVINTLLNLLNQGGYQYDYVVSGPLGPSTYKEEYLFVYRIDNVTVVRGEQYPESAGAFSRPPYIVEFSDTVGQVGNFVLIPQHTSPPSAVQEIDALVDVAAAVTNQWQIQNMLLLGDFNAGCDYVTPADWPNIRLRTATNLFVWLIPDSAVTNVSDNPNNQCPYDRIVATTMMNQHVLPGTAQVYNFRTIYGLNLQQAQAISDHFPVEVELQ